MKKRGVISKFAREQVSDKDLSRLLPSQWLNDELINFYGAMLLARSEKAKENAKNGKSTLPDVHYFSTFFWQKLTTDGYEAGRLAKWTKKASTISNAKLIVVADIRGARLTFLRKTLLSSLSIITTLIGLPRQLTSAKNASNRTTAWTAGIHICSR
jgi:sentrin-specific protease 1